MEHLLEQFERVSDAPEALPRLRRLILDLAIRGKLVPQDPSDEPPHNALSIARATLKNEAACKPRLRWQPSAAISPGDFEREVPRGWIPVRLNDTGLYVNGLAFKPSDWNKSGIPIIRIQNLTDATKEFNYAQGEFPDEVMVRDGDILVSWSATLEAFQWTRGAGVLNQHIFRVIPAANLTTPGFLYLLLQHAIQEIAEGVHAHGLVMKHINRGPFLAHIVAIPPLAEQHRIVEKAGELAGLCDQWESARAEREAARQRFTAASLARLNEPDLDPDVFVNDVHVMRDAIGALTANPDQIKQLRQTILNLAVRGKLVPQEPNDEPASELVQKIQGGKSSQMRLRKRNALVEKGKDALFPCPRGWEWVSLQDLLERDISYGVIKLGLEPKAGGVPTIRCSDVKQGFIDLSGVRTVSEEIEAKYSRTRLTGGEVLINIRGTLGGVAKVSSDLQGFNVAREVAVVPIAKILSAEFMVYLMLSPYFWDAIQKNLRGIAYKGLNLGALREFLVALPPLAEQVRIVRKVDELMGLCDELELSLASQSSTRLRLLDALLARNLITGQREAA